MLISYLLRRTVFVVITAQGEHRGVMYPKPLCQKKNYYKYLEINKLHHDYILNISNNNNEMNDEKITI